MADDLQDLIFSKPEDFLSHGDLLGADFYHCTFKGLDLGAIFQGKRMRFYSCHFESCNLSNLRVTGFVFRGARFKQSKLVGVNWTEASSLVDPLFEDCKLDHAVFQRLDLTKISFKGSSLRDVDFADTHLSGADLRDCELQGASFRGADLCAADLRGAREYFIDPEFSSLKELRCDSPAALSFLVALGLKVED
ncbi:MAG: pentapeptide repeat-containing protein [Bdellovibrionota bacterium]